MLRPSFHHTHLSTPSVPSSLVLAGLGSGSWVWEKLCITSSYQFFQLLTLRCWARRKEEMNPCHVGRHYSPCYWTSPDQSSSTSVARFKCRLSCGECSQISGDLYTVPWCGTPVWSLTWASPVRSCLASVVHRWPFASRPFAQLTVLSSGWGAASQLKSGVPLWCPFNPTDTLRSFCCTTWEKCRSPLTQPNPWHFLQLCHPFSFSLTPGGLAIFQQNRSPLPNSARQKTIPERPVLLGWRRRAMIPDPSPLGTEEERGRSAVTPPPHRPPGRGSALLFVFFFMILYICSKFF